MGTDPLNKENQMNTLRITAATIAVLLLGINGAEAKPTSQQRIITDALPSHAETYTDMSARRKHKHRRYAHRRHRAVDANGNKATIPSKLTTTIVSHKTGAKATVATKFADKFQAYIDDIETNYGAKVLFMGGIRRGPCHSGSLHPCGMAVDVCQYSRGVVESKCNLPGRVALGAVALKHGLFEGGMWCDQDYGHVQAAVSATPCVNNILAAVRKFKLVVLNKVDDEMDPEAKAWAMESPQNLEEKMKVTRVSADNLGGGRSRHRTRVARHRHRHKVYASVRQQWYVPPDRYAYH